MLRPPPRAAAASTCGAARARSRTASSWCARLLRARPRLTDKARAEAGMPRSHLMAPRVAQIDGEPVLKANNYDLECGEQSIFDVELKRAAPGVVGSGLWYGVSGTVYS